MRIILGPPGTGKTTKLLKLVEQYMADGVPPDKIGYFSFTRKAAYEAVDRAAQKFQFSDKDIPYFRTLHSLGFQLLGMPKNSLMNKEDYDNIAKWLKIPPFLASTIKFGDVSQYGKGDAYLETINHARMTDQSLRAVYNSSPVRFRKDWKEVEQVATGIAAWKREFDKFDYPDMIDLFIQRDLAPRLEVLFIDEAQDLSAMQWKMVRCLAAKSKDVYIAGDDDQAIYRWAGADVAQFIGLEGEVEVLNQSYRIPRLHHNISQKVLLNIRARRPKDFRPREEQGFVRHYTDPAEVDLSEGSWLLLARTNRQIGRLKGEVRKRGLLYNGNDSFDLDEKCMRAAQCWEFMRTGGRVKIGDLKACYEFLGVQFVERGHKSLKNRVDLEDWKLVSLEDVKKDHGLVACPSWEVALNKMPAEQREYIRMCLRKGQRLDEKPRITISTVHSSKGGEADHVMLLTEAVSDRMKSQGALDEAQMEDEHRVWYVGLTRARQGLHLVKPSARSRSRYDVPSPD
jgi:superfamily I DNA/RNA helicase